MRGEMYTYGVDEFRPIDPEEPTWLECSCCGEPYHIEDDRIKLLKDETGYICVNCQEDIDYT